MKSHGLLFELTTVPSSRQVAKGVGRGVRVWGGGGVDESQVTCVRARMCVWARTLVYVRVP